MFVVNNFKKELTDLNIYFIRLKLCKYRLNFSEKIGTNAGFTEGKN